MDITKLVITGSVPEASLEHIKEGIWELFAARGYTVIFVPDAGTELISSGISPIECGSKCDFCRILLRHRLAMEASYEDAVMHINPKKPLMIYIKGLMDDMVHAGMKNFSDIMACEKTDIVRLRDRYDAVFALSPDEKTISAWTGHTHLRIINEGTADAALASLIKEMDSFLGIPEPLEIERKYLIEYPDLDKFEAMPNCHRIQIEQIYLDTPDRARIRKRGENGSYIFTHNVKKQITNARRVEIERAITESEYEEYKKYADKNCRPIIKDRWCLSWDSQYFEIDVFPFWNDIALMEIELTDESDEIRFPDCVNIIREVTEEDRFKNSELAKIGAQL